MAMWINKLGSFLIIVGFLILFFIYSPVLLKEVGYQVKKSSFDDYLLVESPDEIEEAEKRAELEFRKTVLIPKAFDFSLVIPKIGVNEEVFPNIDTQDEDEYLPVLKKGVAHGKGSSFPGRAGTAFLFAHSTDDFYNIPTYNASFFLLNKLKKGDDIFVFYQNRKYSYKVKSKKILGADEVGEYIKKLEDNELVLQTCWPPGTTLKRLLVEACL
jgi:LPXTG-site transpeptidase (sortase) family protein